MKRYRLLKDLPKTGAGTLFIKEDGTNFYCPEDYRSPSFHESHVEVSPDWFEEVKEIPEDQAWVVPGTKYRHINWGLHWFIPQDFNFERNKWAGVSAVGCDEAYTMNKHEWLVVREPEKPKRFAPAYGHQVGYGSVKFRVTTNLFESEFQARTVMEDEFFEWPALPDSDGYYPGPKGER